MRVNILYWIIPIERVFVRLILLFLLWVTVIPCAFCCHYYLFKIFFDENHFKSLYWICCSIACVFFISLSFFLILFIYSLNRRIIVLPNFVVFCQISTWISHRSPPSWTSLPSPSPFHPSRLLQSSCLSSLSQIANSRWPSVLLIVM